MALPSTGYGLATVTNPGSALTDFTVIVDLSRMHASWWAEVDTSDGTKGRAAIDSTEAELPCDWIDFDDTAETGFLRVKWSGTLSASGTQKLRVYPPVAANASVAANATYGSDNAYDLYWQGYWPDGGGNDRTKNSYHLSAAGSPSIGGTNGPLGKGTEYNGIDQSSYIEMGVVPNLPSTLFGWFNPVELHYGTLICPSRFNASNIYRQLSNRTEAEGDVLRALSRDGTAGGPSSTKDYELDKWQSGAGVYIEGTEATVYLDGGNSASLESLGTPTGINNFEIGAIGRSNAHASVTKFKGVLSQLHAHSIDRDGAWIAYEDLQVRDNNTFWGNWIWKFAVDPLRGLSNPTRRRLVR
jgi:hypothetical protein